MRHEGSSTRDVRRRRTITSVIAVLAVLAALAVPTVTMVDAASWYGSGDLVDASWY